MVLGVLPLSTRLLPHPLLKTKITKETINKRCLEFVLFVISTFDGNCSSYVLRCLDFFVVVFAIWWRISDRDSCICMHTIIYFYCWGALGILCFCLLMAQKYSNNCLLKHFIEHFWATCLLERCSTHKAYYHYYPSNVLLLFFALFI